MAPNAPGLSGLIKTAAGIAPEREFPAYATRTLRRQFKDRSDGNGPEVVLFPDTFTNYFQPEIGMAAADVLRAAGYRVRIPRRVLCCGRPLYAEGMLGHARRLLEQVLETLGPEAERGVPIVGLEPSCVAVFRDELVNMFPHDPRTEALSQHAFMLGEFLAREGVELPRLKDGGRAVVHFHCNHHAVLDPDADKTVLSGIGLEVDVLDSGCCGMAGSFGFQAEHYDVSMKCGERVLLPAVRDTPDGDYVITDGFSCREQIRQATGRRALHLAEVLRGAMA